MAKINFFIVLLMFLGVSSCSKVDDYLLGKDNTPVPSVLLPIDAKVVFNKRWTLAQGTTKNNNTFLKLKPAVVGDIIYTASPNGLISAVNKNNGRLIWSHSLNTGLVSGPTVKQNVIAVSTNSSSIMVVSQQNGKTLWQASVSSDVLSKPVITQNKVIVKTIDGRLSAFNLKNGQKIWSVEHGAPNLILRASSSPIIMGNTVVAGYSDGKLEAVDIATGQLIWQKNIVYSSGASDIERLVDIDADPIVQGKTILLATYQGYIGSFSLTNGEFIWKKPASTFTNIAVQGNTIYMADANDTVWSINKNSGQVNWKQTALHARGLTAPVLLNNQLIVGDKMGYVHVISTHNGELIGRTSVGSAVSITPTVSGSRVYIMSDNGNLDCFSVS